MCSTALFHDNDVSRAKIRVEANLAPFLQEDGKPLGAVAMVAEDATIFIDSIT